MSRLSAALRALRGRGGPRILGGLLHVEHPRRRIVDATFRGECSVGALTYFSGAALVLHADIGRYCSIAENVTIGAIQHVTTALSTHPEAGGRPERSARTTIGHDVWIGTNAVIVSGLTIGNGAIIGAGAVVTRSVEPYAIMAGVPARLLRMRFPPDVVAALQQRQWWNYEIDNIADFTDPIRAADAVIARGRRFSGQTERVG